jgi:guanine deaminase
VNETRFICRGFTYVPGTSSQTGISVCWLHSDDSTSVGPRALKPLTGAIYMERVPCLDCKLNAFLSFFIEGKVVL